MSGALNSQPYRKLLRLLAEARREAGLTQADVAKYMKRPQSFVSKYESGERRLDVVEFVQVCRAVGLSATETIASIDK